jgi:type II secretory pathway pseudopilin PulG
VVVLAIVSIAAAFAVPALAGRFTRRAVPDAARAFTGLVTEARVQAASTGRPAAVVWLPRSRRLTVVRVAAGHADGRREERAGATRSVAAVPADVEVVADGLAPVRGVGAGGEDARGAVLFPGGGSTGGAIVFRSAGTAAIRIALDPLTGYPREEPR